MTTAFPGGIVQRMNGKVPLVSAMRTIFREVNLSLADILGEKYVAAVCAAGAGYVVKTWRRYRPGPMNVN